MKKSGGLLQFPNVPLLAPRSLPCVACRWKPNLCHQNSNGCSNHLEKANGQLHATATDREPRLICDVNRSAILHEAQMVDCFKASSVMSTGFTFSHARSCCSETQMHNVEATIRSLLRARGDRKLLLAMRLRNGRHVVGTMNLQHGNH